jgi:hypothetical protein
MDKGIKEFDRFIRGKVSDVEFSGEKDSWELLNYQLKEKAKTKWRKRIVAYLFSLLLVASGTLFFVIPFKQQKKRCRWQQAGCSNVLATVESSRKY